MTPAVGTDHRTESASWVPRFIALDLDGTIVDRQGHVSRPVIEVLREASAQGWVVTLATGRSWARTVKVLDAHPDLSWHWVVCSNGAELRERGSAEPVMTRGVGCDASVAALKDTVSDLIVVAEHVSGTYLTTHVLPAGEFDGPQQQTSWSELAVTRCIRWFLTSQTASCEQFESSLGHSDAYDRLVYRLRERTWADLQAANVSKADTLEQLRRRVGVGIDRTLCVGDSWNDIGMLSWAAVGAATEDAPEEVTSVADLLIPTCTEDGVAQLLRRYLDRAASLSL
ncbi:HAD family hydrolase [Streptomyces sp. NBC_01465]|uniref:HAD family hydrolase n=1 Tax=Streptomyces sp. NBC_01465 TaxID=2903878 RepID=UPI002E304625|nr:HAD family hydrolase [Streptomyces sp. NBC_01465]